MGRTQRLRRRQASESTTVDAHKQNSLQALYVQLHAQGWQNSTQLSAHSYVQTGRGLCSKRRSFVAGDELIRLPVECLISIATLEADQAFKGLFNKDLFDKDARISFQALIACYLMHQKHLHDCSQSSHIGVYLDTLPRSYTTPYFCTIPELQCLPESVLERTVAQNRQIRDYYEILKTLVGSQYCEGCGQRYCQEIWSLAEYRVAYFAVNTRSVYLNARLLKLQSSKSHFQPLLSGNTNLALAPFLDLFNHSDAVQTTAEIQGQDYVVTLNGLPIPEVKPYDQLYISYGALTNFKLLTEYGFWLKGNAHDYFEVSLLDIEHMIKLNKTLATQTYHRNIFKFIREHNLCDQMFVHLDDGCSHNLRVVLHLIFKQQAYFPNLLNQIAFGDVDQFDDVQPELAYLVAHKIREYQIFAGELDKLPQLTESGAVARSYLMECVRYLNNFEAAHCASVSDFHNKE
ncbi:SET domain-containing protein 4 [Drosophila pseudoobscura]|uniref:SET domain-containing protein 4 n=1 Tax=Drosophila pseudoobscura pseudoobscura TaxID=46245 RepID=A0A6I8VLJ1_DROPS|nr:SET domain-containing protein 4 [Drosophila pseudoobscura]